MLQGQGHPRKMDKSTILQRTIDFLQKQKGRKGKGTGDNGEEQTAGVQCSFSSARLTLLLCCRHHRPQRNVRCATRLEAVVPQQRGVHSANAGGKAQDGCAERLNGNVVSFSW